MCDYSLHTVASRPAKIGDKLMSTRFVNSITRGFATVEAPNVAVCLLPGTEVAFERDVEYDRGYERGWTLMAKRKLAERVARFRQINIDRPNVHHDALEFANGEIVLVTQLREGQRLTVLQLPAAVDTNEERQRERALV
jgi:hypothetical protein